MIGHNDIIVIAILCLTALAYLARWRPCLCQQCSFHANERRMAAARQAELRHDAQHKGFGWEDSTPDRFNCADQSCSRNKRVE